jgi:hypothetical protein
VKQIANYEKEENYEILLKVILHYGIVEISIISCFSDLYLWFIDVILGLKNVGAI